ncbi:MAG: cadmium-translocating P-type ATPase [Planctomycetota bacterium]|nr:MAG: cadmium-translocating P-type ATPase [Planctomycetota bacterium]
MGRVWHAKELPIAALAIVSIGVYLALRFLNGQTPEDARWVLDVALIVGGGPLVIDLAWNLVRGRFGSDLLAGISIVTSLILGEHLAGVLVVLMLSGGEALESWAVGNASSALKALAARVPSVAHVKRDGQTLDVTVAEVRVGDLVEIYPHEVAPVDGVVVEGRGSMDESFLTGEPYNMSKAPGAEVISGAVNGEHALTIKATRVAEDSRYAKIMKVMRETEQRRPAMRRLGDTLGAWYTPLAVAIAVGAWLISGDPVRFLAVLVVATPCPLLIAIPTAIIGAISIAAKRGIIIKDPAALETIDTCRTIIFDKTGTLTYGRPTVTEVEVLGDLERDRLLAMVGAIERYSKHPLAEALVREAERAAGDRLEPAEVSEKPGEGLRGVVDGREVLITGRGKLNEAEKSRLPAVQGGLECVIKVDGALAGLVRFRDEPRKDSAAFIRHLTSRHHFEKVMLVSGDREEEVRALAERVGITDIHAGKQPEEKVAIVRVESEKARTCFVGDGINDAPALALATVGIAFGEASDITTEAAGVVVMDNALEKVDEFFHISARLRRIALQSAVGGMALSIGGMGFAAAGMLTPVAGALAQELIDVAAVMNALRMSFRPKRLTDIDGA